MPEHRPLDSVPRAYARQPGDVPLPTGRGKSQEGVGSLMSHICLKLQFQKKYSILWKGKIRSTSPLQKHIGKPEATIRWAHTVREGIFDGNPARWIERENQQMPHAIQKLNTQRTLVKKIGYKINRGFIQTNKTKIF